MLLDLIRNEIRERGPLTAAAFMELALYHPDFGFYSRPPQASPADDSITGVTLGPVFGEMLATQLSEMATLLGAPRSAFTLVDAGAGDGRLSHAVLRGLKKGAPHVCAHTHLHLVERSAAARRAQHAVLAAWSDQAIGSDALPDEFEGVVIAHRLISAVPAHRLVDDEGGLREIYVDADGPTLVERLGPLSSANLASRRSGSIRTSSPAGHAVSQEAELWVRDVTKRLTRGFIVIIDDADGSAPRWSLDRPGERELTAQVDFNGLRAAAEAAGATTLGLMDLQAFVGAIGRDQPTPIDDADRRALERLVDPTGPGRHTAVLVLAKGVGEPALRGCPGPATV